MTVFFFFKIKVLILFFFNEGFGSKYFDYIFGLECQSFSVQVQFLLRIRIFWQAFIDLQISEVVSCGRFCSPLNYAPPPLIQFSTVKSVHSLFWQDATVSFIHKNKIQPCNFKSDDCRRFCCRYMFGLKGYADCRCRA